MQHQQARFLLVGEGNFSFSVHLYKERGCDTHIIATCYGSEESISEQAFTKSNVQFLRDKGKRGVGEAVLLLLLHFCCPYILFTWGEKPC